MGRHTAPSRPPVHEAREHRRAAWVALPLVLALLVAVGWWQWPVGARETASECAARPVVTIAVAPAMAPVVEAAATRARTAGACADYRVATADPVAVVGQIKTGQTPDAWVPDSTTWVDQVNSETVVAAITDPTKRTWHDPQPLATSPVVVVIPPDLSTKASAAKSWRTLLSGAVPLRMADPNQDAVGRLTLFAARAALGDSDTARKVAGAALITLSRSATATTDQLFDGYSADPEQAPAFSASEQDVLAFNRAHAAAAVDAVVPTEGTAVLDYPWVVSPRLEEARRGLLDALHQQLVSPAGAQDIVAAGFRRANGGSGPGGVLPTGEVKQTPALPKAAQQSALGLWNAIRANVRMLAVIDVSGSMKEKAGSRTKIELAYGAAQTALATFPPGSQVGLWEFSTDRGGPGQDWKALVPIRDTGSAIGGTTQNQILLDAFKKMTTTVGGDTGLYDTTLAAYREVKRTYVEGAVNSIVLLTDGVNDDPKGGLDLDGLVAALRKEQDPERPVRVILVGMGPTTDAKALAAIAKATGGASYVATNPEDITTVFVQAILSRA